MRHDKSLPEGKAISKDKNAFDGHVVQPGQTLDLDDIVDDDVTPFLTLEVDGLTSGNDPHDRQPELQSDDAAVGDEPATFTSGPVTPLDADELEVYGWESSLWRKILGYLGL